MAAQMRKYNLRKLRGQIYRQFNRPQSGVKISNRPENAVLKPGRTRVRALAAEFGAVVNNKTRFSKRQRDIPIPSSSVAGRKTRRRGKGKGKKSKRRV